MTSSLPFIDRIRVLCRSFIEGGKGNNTALNRPRNYEIRILPSSLQADGGRSRSSDLLAIKLVPTVARPRPSARADRLRWTNQRSGRDMEHTRSNLG